MLIRSDDPSEPIDLAHIPDFALGGIMVRPSSREIECRSGRESLEPRVMQVLVALADAQGAVVSRDHLVRRCWDGRSVGEDAINRCIGKLRRIAEAGDTHSFTIDTIPRVGYRLVLTSPAPSLPNGIAAPAAVAATPQSLPKRPQRYAVLAGASALAVLVIGGIAFFADSWMAPKHWTVESVRPLVATPLIERHPALSPDGTMLIYSSGKDVFTRQLYLLRLAGGDPIRLTNDGYDHVAANWSRDGGRIVYVAVKQGESCHFFVMPVPSGLAREVGRCLSEERSRADWDIGGLVVYFSDRPAKGQSSRIYRLEIATGKRTELTHPPGNVDGDQEPSVSPDGERVGYVRFHNEADVALQAYELATRRETTLYRQFIGFFPSWMWAENSRDVLIADQRNSVLRRHFASGGMETLFSSSFAIGRMSRGPNGLIAAEMDVYRTNVAMPPPKLGGEPVFIDPANNQTWGLSFAPDGTLALASNRTGEDAIWLMQPGKPASQLVSFGNLKPLSLAWSQDGQRIAALLGSPGYMGIRILSRGGTELLSIPLASGDAGDLQWTADGKALVFPMRDGKGFRVMRLDFAQSATMTPLTGYSWMSVRLHGKEIYGVKDDQPGIWRIGDTPQLIVAKFPTIRMRQWRIEGNDIIYVDESDRTHLRLRAHPLSGGADRIFAETPHLGDDTYSGDTGEFAINPKTGQVVYTSAVQVDTDIHLLRLTQR